MIVEIERKFLVNGSEWKKNAEPVFYAQGYLNEPAGVTVRARIAGNKAFITIKSKSKGISSQEFEYEVPVSDAK